MYNIKGFTLIELLVVLLIIGVLAAIALPMYQLAIDKANFQSMVVVADNIAKAQDVHYLEKGAYASQLADLEVTIPAAYKTHKTDASAGDCYATSSSWSARKVCASSMSTSYTLGTPYQVWYIHWFSQLPAARAAYRGRRYCVILAPQVSGNLARWKRLCGNVGTETSLHFWGNGNSLVYELK